MIQIDMEMPIHCEACPLNDEYAECALLGEVVAKCGRLPNCPLREVKDGRKDKYIAWLEKQVIDQTKKSYPEMVLSIYDAGKAYDAIHHLLKLLEESEAEPNA